MPNFCQSCMSRMPYATLIASIMCLLGVGIFCVTMNRGALLSVIMLDKVFRLRVVWIETMRIMFTIIAIAMGALALMILFVGFLATGATRYKVYRAWRSRVTGRISCAILLGITYLLNILWTSLLCFLAIITFTYTIFFQMCKSVEQSLSCIDLTQFNFMFPDTATADDMKVCGKIEIKAFCKDNVESVETLFILATFSTMLIILSLVHFLMCLSANYAHIRDHDKFQELQEMQNLESNATLKHRF